MSVSVRGVAVPGRRNDVEVGLGGFGDRLRDVLALVPGHQEVVGRLPLREVAHVDVIEPRRGRAARIAAPMSRN
jgi:hypothetical protein